MAVGGRLRHRRFAVLPDLQPHRSGQAVRPRRRLRAPACFGTASGGCEFDPRALDPTGRTAEWLPIPDRGPRPRTPGVIETPQDVACRRHVKTDSVGTWVLALR